MQLILFIERFFKIYEQSFSIPRERRTAKIARLCRSTGAREEFRETFTALLDRIYSRIHDIA